MTDVSLTEPPAMYCSRFDFATPLYDASVDLRTRVLREPLGLVFTVDQLTAEWSQWHLAIFAPDDSLLGCLVLVPGADGAVKMRQVAIEPGMQGRGLGRFLVAYSEQVARSTAFERMILHARSTAVPFYQRLGYSVVGQPFEEVGIPHMAMAKELSARVDDQ
jgi:predicted GNAT family N-acyltransferase